LHTLPFNGRIGTTSPRRRAQLLALRPDLTFVELRGNVDTRLRKLEEGECDALVLACAGLDRLERTESVHQRFAIDELTPAPGQGALALETRADSPVRAILAALDHEPTRFATGAERAFLSAIGGGCDLPLGAHCLSNGYGWTLHAQVLAPDGEQSVQIALDSISHESAPALGHRAAQQLISLGALDLLTDES
jgi:hydroxymethylbilane synthase